MSTYSIRERADTASQIQGSFCIMTNVGVFGNLVGYGKALTALSLVTAIIELHAGNKEPALSTLHAGSQMHMLGNLI